MKSSKAKAFISRNNKYALAVCMQVPRWVVPDKYIYKFSSVAIDVLCHLSSSISDSSYRNPTHY